jgi:hypothetical protein
MIRDILEGGAERAVASFFASLVGVGETTRGCLKSSDWT